MAQKPVLRGEVGCARKGKRCWGGKLRARIVKLCRGTYGELGKPELSETQVLGKACDNSPMFCGLFTV